MVIIEIDVQYEGSLRAAILTAKATAARLGCHVRLTYEGISLVVEENSDVEEVMRQFDGR